MFKFHRISFIVIVSLTLPVLAQGAGGARRQVEWRGQITHANSRGTGAPSRWHRESIMREWIQTFEEMVLNEKSTPVMALFVADGVQEQSLVRADYESGTVPRVKISNLRNGNVLAASLLLPVSGHVGRENALKWSKTDTYDIVYENENGEKTKLVQGAQSLGVTTVQELEIPLVKDAIVSIYYIRSGSLGPSGFIAGRKLELIWDGT